jgi:hypothetical protein
MVGDEIKTSAFVFSDLLMPEQKWLACDLKQLLTLTLTLTQNLFINSYEERVWMTSQTRCALGTDLRQ